MCVVDARSNGSFRHSMIRQLLIRNSHVPPRPPILISCASLSTKRREGCAESVCVRDEMYGQNEKEAEKSDKLS